MRYFWMVLALFPTMVLSVFERDIFMDASDLSLSNKNIVIGTPARFYATVHNASDTDQTGVVRFFDETTKQDLGKEVTFNAVAGRSDDVFIDFTSTVEGTHSILVQAFPWNTEGDNPDNNALRFNILVDKDMDGDGEIDAIDADRDGDGVDNQKDMFPDNKREWRDTDRDGEGDELDGDDDNDGISDVIEREQGTNPLKRDTDGDGVDDGEDVFPLNKKEFLDTDKDGLGDNEDTDDDNDGILDELDEYQKNQGPYIEVSFPTVSKVGETVVLDASKSYDIDGEIARVEWYIGDERLEGLRVEKVFREPGIYKINVKVFDNQEDWRHKEILIDIDPRFDFTKAFMGLVALFCFIFAGFLWKRKQDEAGA